MIPLCFLFFVNKQAVVRRTILPPFFLSIRSYAEVLISTGLGDMTSAYLLFSLKL
jgi:hypothetical protein